MVDRGVFTDIFNPLSFVDATVRTFALTKGPIHMEPTFVPHSWSVICGRGKECYNHEGNRRFRVLCEQYLDRYKTARTKVEKSQIVTTIVDAVRAGGDGGGGGGTGDKGKSDREGSGSDGVGAFVARDPQTNRWMDVGDDAAREKTGQQLRDLLTRRRVGCVGGGGTSESDLGVATSSSSAAADPSTMSTGPSRRKRSAAEDEDDNGSDDSRSWTRPRLSNVPKVSAASPQSQAKAISPTPSSCSTATLHSSASPACIMASAEVTAVAAAATAGPPVLAAAVSLGGPTDHTSYPAFAMPSSRVDSSSSSSNDTESHVPFWSSPLGVAANLHEFFDHGQDSDSDNDNDEDAETPCDPLDRVRVPQF